MGVCFQRPNSINFLKKVLFALTEIDIRNNVCEVKEKVPLDFNGITQEIRKFFRKM